MEQTKKDLKAQSAPVEDVIPAIPHEMRLAFAYIKYQQWGNTYAPCDALTAGTAFEALDMPYCPCRKGDCNESK